MFGKEVNKTAVDEPGSTEAEQNVCTEESHEECQPGARRLHTRRLRKLHRPFLAVDNSPGGEGDVYVGDPGDDLVSKFDPSGNLITSWGERRRPRRRTQRPARSGGACARAWNSLGIAVDPDGNLFVAAGIHISFSSPRTAASFRSSRQNGGLPQQTRHAVDGAENFYVDRRTRQHCQALA